MTASDILQLIKKRHEKDIVVPQCKTGATWINNHLLILDAWVMKRSWVHPLFTGYEIKVSRQDFLHDEKWKGYLPYCNLFYFVCPHGLILPTELPAEAGLLWASKTGGKLYEKKKAVHREVNIPDNLYRYLLMSRTKIVNTTYSLTEREYWELWLKDKEGNRRFGEITSRKIREEIERRVSRVTEENERVRKENKKFQEIKEIIENLGFKGDDPADWGFVRSVRQKLITINAGIPEGLDGYLNKTIENLKRIKDIMEIKS